MNPNVLAKIRESIPVEEMSDDRISTLLLNSATLLKLPEEIRERQNIIKALGYDPEDKWK